MSNDLITKSFRTQALAFPSRVDLMLASIETIEEAKGLLDQAAALQEYASRLKAGIEIEKPIAEGVIKIKAKLGKLMPAKTRNESGEMKGKKGVLEDRIPFDKNTRVAYRKLAANAEKLEEYFDAVKDVPTQSDFIRWCGADSDRHSKNSGEVEWYTPEFYIEKVRRVLGTIDLDPASNSFAQDIVKAKKYFHADDCGLKHSWRGSVFLNPPYRMPDVQDFVFKLCNHYEAKDVTCAILLTNNSTDPKWWQRAARVASAVCFTAGRISFYNKSGKSNSPTHGQTFMYFGKAVKRFVKEFEAVGVVMKVEDQHESS